MANLCSFSMVVVGKNKENINTFIEWMNQKGTTWMGRGAEADIYGIEEDNGEYYEVTKELLEELIADCKYVLSNHDEAENIIPTSSGFFFGSTDYDEWYFNTLENTIQQCEKVISETDWDNETVVYTESW